MICAYTARIQFVDGNAGKRDKKTNYEAIYRSLHKIKRRRKWEIERKLQKKKKHSDHDVSVSAKFFFFFISHSSQGRFHSRCIVSSNFYLLHLCHYYYDGSKIMNIKMKRKRKNEWNMKERKTECCSLLTTTPRLLQAMHTHCVNETRFCIRLHTTKYTHTHTLYTQKRNIPEHYITGSRQRNVHIKMAHKQQQQQQ